MTSPEAAECPGQPSERAAGVGESHVDATEAGPSASSAEGEPITSPVSLPLDAWATDVCGLGDLRHSDAKSLAELLERERLPFAHRVEYRVGPNADVIVVDVEVQLVQHPVHDIRPIERIAVVFGADGAANTSAAPEVLALREDFPVDVPHVNLRAWDRPVSLCLYDVPFRDIQSQWTPARFIALVRQWFALTARGELHADDQPLEPLLADGAGFIVLPSAALEVPAGTANEEAPGSLRLSFSGRPELRGKPVLVAQLVPSGATMAADTDPWIAAVVRARPRTHGVIRRSPRTLADLHALLSVDGDDLLGTLKRGFLSWERNSAVLDARFVLVVSVPKVRVEGGDVENVEPWAFFTDKNVYEVGESLGLWTKDPEGRIAPLLPFMPNDSNGGVDVKLELAHAFVSFTRPDAASLNGRGTPDDRDIVAIGGGALGSQVMLDAARAAFGRWTVIDDDLLLPHNLARHALPAHAVGYPKATFLALTANHLTDDDHHRGIVADVLAPGPHAAEVVEALATADLIVDLSASVTVARALARDVTVGARRVSIFMNPSGSDLTLLAEDTSRSTPLDALEMQYYRAVAHRPDLRTVLSAAQSRHRYGRSCRDVSVQMPQSMVAMHAGLAARALEQTVASPEARLRVWRIDPERLSVQAIDVPVARATTCALPGGWTVVTDDALLGRLAELRTSKLPNETGGVLVGAVDLARRILYVVDTVPSPNDSHEYPTSYLRGAAGLREAVDEIETLTAGQLHYIGEWHSHPAGYPCLPSGADRRLFDWLADAMASDGLPALMLIVGDGGLAVPYVAQIPTDGGYPAELRPAKS